MGDLVVLVVAVEVARGRGERRVRPAAQHDPALVLGHLLDERAGVLTGTAWVGTHDWYLEGAEYLLKAQRPDGSWSGSSELAQMQQVDTCFALLFLKRATTRLHTPTKARDGTATAPAEEGLDPSTGPALEDAAFRDLFEAVFRRYAAAGEAQRQERAADFVRMGTRSIPLLLLRLGSEDPAARGAAIDALRRTTGETQGFDPAAPEAARAAAIDAWERWWFARKARLVADPGAGRFREGP